MDKTLLGISMLFFLAFVVFMTFMVFNDQLTTAARASNQSFSPQRSLVFGWPLNLKADGKERAEITVFIRDNEGDAVPNRIVSAQTTLGTLDKDTVQADANGKAVFTLTSTTPGLAELEAFVDNTPITTRISIQFQ
ncbi:MAG: Ig-like domain-containing protein [Patescibacteria group bacterium]|nr:Ig-like domain-containing protein [Patescibacteria group bacterium]